MDALHTSPVHSSNESAQSSDESRTAASLQALPHTRQCWHLQSAMPPLFLLLSLLSLTMLLQVPLLHYCLLAVTPCPRRAAPPVVTTNCTAPATVAAAGNTAAAGAPAATHFLSFLSVFSFLTFFSFFFSRSADS